MQSGHGFLAYPVHWNVTNIFKQHLHEDEAFCDMLCTEVGKVESAPAKRALKRKLMDHVYAAQKEEQSAQLL